ncbi:hypothetical protein EPUL_005409 [Erysiphe pulchra]|uniref:Uncharacterized protein n=1 Tax=Erysiphe pulchra TaxID=225359 RepID=A0A2S4PND8_9PEZI|nr:hypothetical protein EPUL_005409 [Erysiphe pulchra]
MFTDISAKEEVPNIPGTILEYPSERDKRAKERGEQSREIESRTEEWRNGIDPDRYSPSQLNHNSNKTKTEPITFNPAKYDQTQKHPEPCQNHKDIANPTRTYNDEIKYSGETSDNFDDKFNIFMDYCTRFGISSQALHNAFPCMLKGMALTFYYNKCRGKSIENLQILMKLNFEGPEYQRYNLKRWMNYELTFQNIIDSNPDKNPMEQVKILTITLDKMQKTLSSEWQSEAVMHNKIVSACKDIEACKMACYRPSQTIAGLILDLKSGVEIHNKPLGTSSTAIYHSNPSNNNAYFTDRRYYD